MSHKKSRHVDDQPGTRSTKVHQPRRSTSRHLDPGSTGAWSKAFCHPLLLAMKDYDITRTNHSAFLAPAVLKLSNLQILGLDYISCKLGIPVETCASWNNGWCSRWTQKMVLSQWTTGNRLHRLRGSWGYPVGFTHPEKRRDWKHACWVMVGGWLGPRSKLLVDNIHKIPSHNIHI